MDTGAYVVRAPIPNYLWQTCLDSIALTFSGTAPTTDSADFPIQAAYDCPAMQVDLGVGALRPCFAATYTAQYCNLGNQPANPALLALHFDPLLTVESASLPYTTVGDTLWFDLGAVAAGDCGSVQVTVGVSCDAELGQALCASAQAFPDSLCAASLPGWSGARIEVSAACEGDSVRLRLHNTGSAPTSQPLDFIVIDDHVITRSGSFTLTAGESRDEYAPADGSTWRLTAQQEPGYPYGPQMPSVALEGCAPGGGGTTGMLNLFANYSGNPFSSEACQVVTNSYDPNDKQAFPLGVHAEHFIEANTPLDYQIRFQNTGTNTAFTVVIRDTLSPWLDPASVRPGAASHPYTWTLGGAGILTFTFENILLPDSNVNEAASHGFVQFAIDQRKDNPDGAVIENRAGIFFDFNAPVLTNTVFHTIGHDFLPVATREPGVAALPLLQVWPNPAAEVTIIWGEKPFQPGQRLLVRDALGRVLRDLPAGSGPLLELRRDGLPAGLYFLEVQAAGRTLALGKVIWR